MTEALTTADIARIVKGKAYGASNNPVRHLLIDSRSLTHTGELMFVALVTSSNDGHKYIDELLGAGVPVFLVSKLPEDLHKYKKSAFILVEDTLDALQRLGAWKRSVYKGKVLAITGSNGKTIVKEWLWQVLTQQMPTYRSPRSYNSQIGVPLSAWYMADEHKLSLMEAGISQPGEMDRLENILKPDLGIFTNIGQAHQENFRDLKEKILEKFRLFKKSESLVVCSDQKELFPILAEEATREGMNLLSWGSGAHADVVLKNRSLKQGSQTGMEVQYGDQVYNFIIPFTNPASVENAMHVFTACIFLGADLREVCSAMEKLEPVAMRMELIKGIDNSLIINDTYNADLVSLSTALEFLQQQKKPGPRVLVLSDLFQTGMDKESLYRQVARMVDSKKIDRMIGVGEGLKRHARFFDTPAQFFKDTGELIGELSSVKYADGTVLLKGSRKYEFEKLASLLEEKTHQTVLQVDLNALVHNLNHYRTLIRSETRIMVMVKAFSYGSGSHEIASVLESQGVDYLGVAFADEGIKLRREGIGLPIMVMSPDTGSFRAMIEFDLEPEIYNMAGLKTLIRLLESNSGKTVNIHLKLDTGMHRLGFDREQLPGLIDLIREQDSIRVKSIFSHLIASDDPSKDHLTEKQIKVFEKMSEEIMKELDYPVWRHILNSAGIERFPQARFDMVRLGIGLYGISGDGQTKLLPVSTLKTVILQLRQVKAGAYVSYGGEEALKEDKEIATIPVGYADGIDRKLSNGQGKFLVRNVLVPAVGKICMDMCMLDVTGLHVQEGEEVVIFGENPTVSDLAAWAGTIPYEILAGIPERVKRIYIKE